MGRQISLAEPTLVTTLGTRHHRVRLPPDIRRVIYTTNAIESLNSVIRKAINNRRIFPSDRSALKVVYLAVEQATEKVDDAGPELETGPQSFSPSSSRAGCHSDSSGIYTKIDRLIGPLKPLVAVVELIDGIAAAGSWKFSSAS